MIWFFVFSLATAFLGEMMAGGGKKCSMECPKGQVPAIKEKYHFNSNGCGYGSDMKVGGAYDFSPCCDMHDVCFTVCNAKFQFCEKEFKACQQKICDKQDTKEDAQACQGQLQLYSMGTGLFGCGVFPASQEEGCDCVSRKEFPERQQAWLEHFKDTFVPAEDELDIDAIVATKNRGKQAQKIVKVLNKYRESIRLDYNPEERAQAAIETKARNKAQKAQQQAKLGQSQSNKKNKKRKTKRQNSSNTRKQKSLNSHDELR